MIYIITIILGFIYYELYTANKLTRSSLQYTSSITNNLTKYNQLKQHKGKQVTLQMNTFMVSENKTVNGVLASFMIIDVDPNFISLEYQTHKNKTIRILLNLSKIEDIKHLGTATHEEL